MVKKSAASSARAKPAQRKGKNNVKKPPITPLRATKQAISLRIDADVLAWFRAAGAKYQTRMNDVLRDYVKRKIKS